MKWFLVGLCLVLAVAASLWGWSLMLLCAVLALGVALTTPEASRALVFWSEARIELRKVVWPSREETTHSTIVVVLMVLATAILLWMIDAILSFVLSRLTL